MCTHPRRRRPARLGLLLLGLFIGQSAKADPGYYLATPYSVPAQAAMDLRYWTVRSPGQSAALWPELGLRYGFGSRWTSEVLASFIGDSFAEQNLSSWHWKNTYLLTQGQFAFDMALHADLIRNAGHGNAIEAGTLWQTDLGSTAVNVDLLLERSGVAGDPTVLKVQSQVLHRLVPGLRWGLQGFADITPWNHSSAGPSLRAGPVLHLDLAGDTGFQAAYLWGKTYGARGDMFSAQVLLPF